MTSNTAEFLRRLLIYQENGKLKCKSIGYAFLVELASKPNATIHCSQLRNLYNLPGRGAEEMSIAYKDKEREELNFCISSSPLPIQVIDEQTLQQTKQRLQSLIALEAELLNWNDLARLDEVRSEKEQLVEYLKECLDRKGRIRSLNQTANNDYRMVYRSINRVICKIREIDPELAEEVLKHLETGIYFKWKEVV